MVPLEERHSQGWWSLVVMATSEVGQYDVMSRFRDFLRIILQINEHDGFMAVLD